MGDLLFSVPALVKIIPMRNPMRGALFSQDLDRGDGFENGPKWAPLCANPLRGRRGGAGQEKERRERRWGGGVEGSGERRGLRKKGGIQASSRELQTAIKL